MWLGFNNERGFHSRPYNMNEYAMGIDLVFVLPTMTTADPTGDQPPRLPKRLPTPDHWWKPVRMVLFYRCNLLLPTPGLVASKKRTIKILPGRVQGTRQSDILYSFGFTSIGILPKYVLIAMLDVLEITNGFWKRSAGTWHINSAAALIRVLFGKPEDIK